MPDYVKSCSLVNNYYVLKKLSHLNCSVDTADQFLFTDKQLIMLRSYNRQTSWKMVPNVYIIALKYPRRAQQSKSELLVRQVTSARKP